MIIYDSTTKIHGVIQEVSEPSAIDVDYFGVYLTASPEITIEECDVHNACVEYITHILKIYTDNHMAAYYIKEFLWYLTTIYILPWEDLEGIDFYSRDVEVYWDTVLGEWIFTEYNTLIVGEGQLFEEYTIYDISDIYSIIHDNEFQRGKISKYPIFSETDVVKTVSETFALCVHTEDEITYTYKSNHILLIPRGGKPDGNPDFEPYDSIDYRETPSGVRCVDIGAHMKEAYTAITISNNGCMECPPECSEKMSPIYIYIPHGIWEEDGPWSERPDEDLEIELHHALDAENIEYIQFLLLGSGAVVYITEEMAGALQLVDYYTKSSLH